MRSRSVATYHYSESGWESKGHLEIPVHLRYLGCPLDGRARSDAEGCLIGKLPTIAALRPRREPAADPRSP